MKLPRKHAEEQCLCFNAEGSECIEQEIAKRIFEDVEKELAEDGAEVASWSEEARAAWTALKKKYIDEEVDV